MSFRSIAVLALRVRSLGATGVTILGGPNSVAEAVTVPTLC